MIDYAAFFRTLWRRKFVLLGITLLGLAATAFMVARMPPQYVAHAFIALGDPFPNSRLVALSNGTPIPPTLPDTGTIQTEVQILRSALLASRVIRQLDLQDHPEFKSSPSLVERVRPLVDRLFGPEITTLTLGAANEFGLQSEDAIRASRTVEAFLGRLQVGPKETSRVIDIGFESSDPQLATRIANAVVDNYLRSQLEFRSLMAQRTSEWLRGKIGTLQASVHRAEEALEHFRAQAGLFSTPGGSPLLLKEMTDASAELAKAQTARAALEAQLTQIRPALAGSAGTPSIGDVTSSPLMRTLEAQEAEASQRLMEALATQGPKNPVPMGINDRLRHIRGAIRNETRRIAAALEEDLKVALLKEKDLGVRLARLQADVAKMNNAEVTLRALEREAQAERLVLSNFMSRFKETTQESDVASQKPDAQIVALAQLPIVPDKPKRGLLMLLGGLGSLLFGIAAVKLVETADRTIRDGQVIEADLKIPTLGVIPVTKSAHLAPSEAARYGTEYREAVKATFARIFWSRQQPKVILVTSALPEEGKTTLALSLAAMAAQSGQRTLFIDSDFWRSGASRFLKMQARPGFAEVLERKAKAHSAVVTDVASGANILLAGRFKRGSLVTWAHSLPRLFDEFREEYDTIIVDAPPVLSVSEATLLMSQVDALIVAVRWGHTARVALAAALRKLQECNAPVVGAVLTMVGNCEYAKYGSEYGNYSLSGLPGYRPATGAITSANVKEASVPASEKGESEAPTKRPWIDSPPAITGSSGLPSASHQMLPRCALLLLDIHQAVELHPRRSLPESVRRRLACVVDQLSLSAFAAGIIVLDACLGRSAGDAGKILLKEEDGAVSNFQFSRARADAFSNRALADFLHDSGVNQIFLAGTDAVEAINWTARSALARGFRVTFIRDAIFTRDDKKWAQLLSIFEQDAAFALTSEEFIEFALALELSSQTPSPLVAKNAEVSKQAPV
jgi:capsular exopolysaccharide synthesis family protein